LRCWARCYQRRWVRLVPNSPGRSAGVGGGPPCGRRGAWKTRDFVFESRVCLLGRSARRSGRPPPPQLGSAGRRMGEQDPAAATIKAGAQLVAVFIALLILLACYAQCFAKRKQKDREVVGTASEDDKAPFLRGNRLRVPTPISQTGPCWSAGDTLRATRQWPNLPIDVETGNSSDPASKRSLSPKRAVSEARKHKKKRDMFRLRNSQSWGAWLL